MVHRRMNSRPSNPAYQFSVHSPPHSPNPLGIRPLPTIPATPITPWMESRPPSPPSTSSSSKNSLDSLPIPYSSSSSLSSGSPKERDFYADEDEDVFVGSPVKGRPASWVKKSAMTAMSRRPRPRTTFVILLLLSALSFYIIFTTSALSSTHLIHPPEDIIPESADVPTNLSKAAWLKAKVNKKLFKGTRPPLVLTPAEELAALTHFVVALPQNVLPSDVDGSKPLDPQLILDFDIRGGRKAREELQVVRNQVWEENPVVIYAKRFAPQTKLLLGNLVNPLNIHPPPAVFFVDERQDSDIITPVLQRVSESAQLAPVSLSGAVLDEIPVRDGSPFPIVLVGGKPIYIPYDEMLDPEKAMEKDSLQLKYRTELKALVLQAGGESRPGKKKGRHH